MKYITEYSNGKHYVRAYDEEKYCLRKVGKLVFIYRNSVICRAIYDTEAEAVENMFYSGKYATQSIIMPDGSETTPAEYFGRDVNNDIFVPWIDIKGELWPGETA